MSEVSEQHAGFQDRHTKSSPALFVVAWWYHEQGKAVYVPGKRQAPSADVHLDYVDNGDMFVLEDGKRVLVEVHHYKMDFTDSYPYDSIILKSVESAKRLGLDNVERFVICNRAITHAAIVQGAVQHPWELHVPRYNVWKTTIRPGNTGNPEDKYVCAASEATFVRLRGD